MPSKKFLLPAPLIISSVTQFSGGSFAHSYSCLFNRSSNQNKVFIYLLLFFLTRQECKMTI